MFGLRAAYGLLYFVCIYYLIFDREAVSSTLAYVRRRFKEKGALFHAYCVYMIFVNQGKNLIDRYALEAKHKKFDIEVRGLDRVRAMLESSDMGAVLLTAHVGNWQATMTALRKLGKVVNLVMRREDNEAVKELLNIYAEDDSIKIIYSDQFLGGVIESSNALSRGEIVSLMGDRAYGASSQEVIFLGELVKFPVGAFVLAATVGCPVIVVLSFKVSGNKYCVNLANVINPAYTSKASRADDIRKWIEQFSGILEEFVQNHPLQWFIFHDIWNTENCETNRKTIKRDGG